MKKLVYSVVNANASPKRFVLPDSCLISTFIFNWNDKLLWILLKEPGIKVTVESNEDDEFILMTLSYDVFNRIQRGDTKLSTIFQSLTW